MSKEKSKSVVTVPTVPAVSFNIEALQALGVGTKITKADLLEYISSQMEEQLRDAMANGVRQMNKFQADYNEKRDKIHNAYTAKLAKEPKVKKFFDVYVTFRNAEDAFQDMEIECGTVNNIHKTVPYKPDIVGFLYTKNIFRVLKLNHIGTCHSSIFQKLVFNSELSKESKQEFTLYTKEEFEHIKRELNRLNDEQHNIQNDLYNLCNHAKNARMAMIKSILGSTKEGVDLLSFLDSRSRSLKALQPLNPST